MQIKVLEMTILMKYGESFLKNQIIFHTITSRLSLEICHFEIALINKK